MTGPRVPNAQRLTPNAHFIFVDCTIRYGGMGRLIQGLLKIVSSQGDALLIEGEAAGEELEVWLVMAKFLPLL